jgi:hypothetical protein
MFINSIPDWLKEQERKKNPSVFVLEWMLTFAGAFLFWTSLLLRLKYSIQSITAAATISIVYACGIVYTRIYPVTSCSKCHSLLPLMRAEIGRRHIHDEERCLEITRGGEEYWGHFIEIYNRIYRVDLVKFRCVKCKAVWEEVEQLPASKYRFIRTIRVKD